MKALSLLFIAIVLTTCTYGQEEVETLRFSAYADVYYGYDFSKPVENQRLYVTQAARHNEFNLNWGYLLAEYEREQVRAKFGMHTGTYVQYNYIAEPNDLTRLIYQANAGVRIIDGVWLEGGIITPHTGYESAASVDNEIYSRALTTEFTPYYLAGAKLTAAVNSKLDIAAVVVNGWQLISETNDDKSFGLSAVYRPSTKLTLSYGNLFGNEAPHALASKKFRSYHNAWVKYSFTDKFHFVASADYGTQEPFASNEVADFTMWMLIAEYKLAETLRLAARAENMRDEHELLVSTSGRGFDLSTFSLTGTYIIAEEAKLRIEIKYGNNERAIFDSDNQDVYRDYFLVVGSVAVRLKRQAGRS